MKLFILTRNGNPPTQKTMKFIVDKYCDGNYSKITSYAGAPLIKPDFILNTIEFDSIIVLLDMESSLTADYYCVKGSEDIEVIKETLKNNINSSSFNTIMNLIKGG